MASEIRVNKINSLSCVGTVTLSPTGVDIAGITTAATLRATTGIVTSLTAGSLTSLGAVSGTTGTFSGAVSGTTGTFTGDVDIADKIIHTGDTDTTIRFPSADTIRFDTGGTEAARINSSQKLIIGDTNSDAQLGVYRASYNLAEFTNTNADATGAEVALRKDSSSPADGDVLGMLKFIGDNDAGEKVNYAYIQSKSSDVSDGTEDGRLEFYTRGAGTLGERLRIDSSGKVHIGLTNGSGQFNVKNQDDTATNALEVYNDNGVRVSGFSQSSAGDATMDLRTNAASQTVLLRSNGISHFSGGDFGLGTSSPAVSNALFGGAQRTLHVSGTAAPMVRIQSSTSGQADLLLQAGNSGADAYIANAASNGDIVFSTNNGGTQGSKLRIRHNGGINFNTDDSDATALDDYEEGSWTPAYASANSTAGSETATAGFYTKIGNMVYFIFRIQMTGSNATYSHLRITGLPFTSRNTDNSQGGMFYNYSQAHMQSNNIGTPKGHISKNVSYIDFYTPQGDVLYANNGTYVNLNETVHAQGFYMTDS